MLCVPFSDHRAVSWRPLDSTDRWRYLYSTNRWRPLYSTDRWCHLRLLVSRMRRCSIVESLPTLCVRREHVPSCTRHTASIWHLLYTGQFSLIFVQTDSGAITKQANQSHCNRHGFLAYLAILVVKTFTSFHGYSESFLCNEFYPCRNSIIQFIMN